MTAPETSLPALLAYHQLFSPDDDVIRIPTLTRGCLNFPRQLPAHTVHSLMTGKDYFETEDLHLVRDSTAGIGGTVPRSIFVLPKHRDLAKLIAVSPRTLVERHFDLEFQRALELIEAIGSFLSPAGAFDNAMRSVNAEGCRSLVQGSPFPWLGAICKSENVRRTVDRELAWGDIEGSRLLSDWQPVDTHQQLANVLINRTLSEQDRNEVSERFAIRALPTRQLHISSANTATGLLFSLIRGLSVKGAVALKMNAGSLISGGALALALAYSSNDHPLVEAASVVYWKGGDADVETTLMHSQQFDRVVVSAGQRIQDAVRARFGGTKIVSFGPRVGVSLLSLKDSSEYTLLASLAVADSLIADQTSCDASIIHFVEGDSGQVAAYAQAVLRCLARWDTASPRETGWDEWAATRRARRGKLSTATWFFNGSAAKPTSAVVVVANSLVGEWIPPMRRLVLIQPVTRLSDAVQQIGPSVSTVGIFSETERRKYRAEILARGASAVVPLGYASNSYSGMPREGIRPLSELVSWVTG